MKNKTLELFLEKNILYLNLIIEDIKKIKDENKEIFYVYEKAVNVYDDDDTIQLSVKKYLLSLIEFMPIETDGTYGNALLEAIYKFIKYTDRYKIEITDIYEDIEYKVNSLIQLLNHNVLYKHIKKDLEYFSNTLNYQKKIFNI